MTADDIKTWSVSEIDKKGKKKKGTLGVGNGAIFFASDSDKVNPSSRASSLLALLTQYKDPSAEMAGHRYRGHQHR